MRRKKFRKKKKEKKLRKGKKRRRKKKKIYRHGETRATLESRIVVMRGESKRDRCSTYRVTRKSRTQLCGTQRDRKLYKQGSVRESEGALAVN